MILKSLKYISPFLLGVAGLFTVASCADDIFDDQQQVADGTCVELTLFTRAEGDTEIDPSKFTDAERNMHSVDLFFYADGAGENATPVKVFSVSNKTHHDVVKVPLTESEVKAMFGENSLESGTTSTAKVYAVVNVPSADGFYNVVQREADGSIKLNGDGTPEMSRVAKTAATVADLRLVKSSSPGFKTEFYDFAMFTKDEEGDVVTLDPTGDIKKMTGKVYLRNLASKIDVFLNFGNANEEIRGINPSKPEEGVKSWVVNTNNGNPTTELHILNGVTGVVLGGYEEAALTDDDFYSIRIGEGDDDYRRGFEASAEEDKEEYPWVSSNPYYSYPNMWQGNPLERHATSLLLKVDWKNKDNANEEITTYYSVPVNIDEKQLASNTYYRLKLHLNSIGGENFGEPVEIEGNWEMLDWGKAALESDLRKVRYLEVDQKVQDIDGTEYTAVINGNDGLVTIPFKTSHETKIESFSISYTSYIDYTNNGKANRDEQVIDPGQTKTLANPNVAAFTKTYDELMDNDWHCAYIDNVNHTITVKHNIGATTPDNGNNPSYYYPNKDEVYMYYTYFIKIKLQHTDQAGFGEESEITIVHHPAIYISGETNIGYNYTYNAFAGANAAQDRSADVSILNAANLYGWVRINDKDPQTKPLIGNVKTTAYGGQTGLQKFFELSDIGSTKSSSPVMYVVTVTQLDGPKRIGTQDMEFHIVDPRVTESNTLNNGNNWTQAPHYVNGTFLSTTSNHRLEYYYPTNRSTVDEIKYGLSPRYRIASSFGNPAQNITSLDNAEKRCAGYTEAGYPAGRWRLPTYGELAFVSYLSKKELIPPIFGGRVLFWSVDAAYWTAQGLFKVDDDGNINPVNSANTQYVRCVYDDWYWVKSDGTPDRIKEPYTGDPETNPKPATGTIFIWGDKQKQSPHIPDKSN